MRPDRIVAVGRRARRKFRVNGPEYWLAFTHGRLEVFFWDKEPYRWWHLSWGGDIWALHLVLGPLIVTVEAAAGAQRPQAGPHAAATETKRRNG